MSEFTNEFVEVTVRGLMVHGPEEHPVLLVHSEEGNRVIPIWIGAADAANFAARDASMTQNRPGIHEVLADTVDILGTSIQQGTITSCFEGVFMGELQLANGMTLDIRPSDMIIVCDLADAPLFIAREVVDSVSVPASRLLDDVLGEGESVDEEVEESLKDFAAFLEGIDATDFTAPDADPKSDES
ncbi:MULTISPECIES: bifunctional nuclease family protein [unclassified Corynebacterium]|uniref:bifunctional nuclease family protein n=1 Tax=unclassified Corynebacterium TaxID=2624378 RepID=UPI0030948772